MELEGVLGRKEYLIDPINALEPTGGAENASKRPCEQKDNWTSEWNAEGLLLRSVPLDLKNTILSLRFRLY